MDSEKYKIILHCTLDNGILTFEDSYVLIRNMNELDSELNIDIKGNFYYNTDFEIQDIKGIIHINNLDNLYKYCKYKDIQIDKKIITERGILVGAERDCILGNDLTLEPI